LDSLKIAYHARETLFPQEVIQVYSGAMIDWNEQWALHAPNFKKGLAHVHLKDYGGPDKTYYMKPGPGFGDLSHPTTQLMLHLMPSPITGQVIDVGCGSGVLSLAAKLRGAEEVYGIDCDEEALCHAKENAKLNQLHCTFGKCLEKKFDHPLILMNMISSEQKCAWSALPPLQSYTLILSGIPIEEARPFAHYGTILEKREWKGWLGFKIQH
jgi:ribosomal protein L11 methyltransferase